MVKMKDYSLYLIVDEEYGRGRDALEIAKSAIKGGVDVIQMREKNKPREELVTLGEKLSSLCRRSRVTFIVNDDPMLAKEVDADGVHLGQEDLKLFPLEVSRRILGRRKIIGVSTHSFGQLKDACEKEFDYVVFGPVFRTEVKNKYAGTKDIEKIIKEASKPVVFIGGITLANVDKLLQRGARNISLIRGIAQEDDIIKAAGSFRAILDKYKKKMVY